MLYLSYKTGATFRKASNQEHLVDRLIKQSAHRSIYIKINEHRSRTGALFHRRCNWFSLSDKRKIIAREIPGSPSVKDLFVPMHYHRQFNQLSYVDTTETLNLLSRVQHTNKT